MNRFFRDHTMKWWEIAILKLTLFVAGLLVGSYWADSFQGLHQILLGFFVLSAIYWFWWMARVLRTS